MCWNSVSTYLPPIHSLTHFNLAYTLTNYIEIDFIKIINNVHVTKHRTRILIYLYMTNFLSSIPYSWPFPIIEKLFILLFVILMLFLLGFPPVSMMVPSKLSLIVSLFLILLDFLWDLFRFLFSSFAYMIMWSLRSLIPKAMLMTFKCMSPIYLFLLSFVFTYSIAYLTSPLAF